MRTPSSLFFRAFKPALFFAAMLPALLLANPLPAWLLVRFPTQESIITTNSGERDKLVASGWRVAGKGSLQQDAQEGSGPLHRLWRASPQGTDRLLETDVGQLSELVKSGFVDEGVIGFVAAAPGAGRAPVYQYLKGDKRIWLIDDATQTTAKKAGWKLQGVHFWLWPVAEKSEPASKEPAAPSPKS
jgi:hypothetical protein